MQLPPPSSRRSRSPSLMLALAFAAVLVPAVQAVPITLAPLYDHDVATGSGASATFVQIDSHWRGSSVLWNETTRSYGSGAPIAHFGWGTGLWGQADFRTAQQAQHTQFNGLPPVVNQWRGVVPTINFGNRLYNDAHSVLWGAAALVPFFYDALADADEHNWTAHFGGFVRVAEAGAYNFSVLFDDGFFFRLLGAGGTAVGIGQDFLNPRDRRGFDHDLLLSPGLYGFELGMWNRAEAGVVDLRWMLPGSTSWTLVPGEHLRPLQQLPPQTLPAAAPPLAVPLPPTAALVLLGLGLLAASCATARHAAARRAGATG